MTTPHPADVDAPCDEEERLADIRHQIIHGILYIFTFLKSLHLAERIS